MSETHERWYTTKKGEDQSLNDLIKLKDHTVISNPYQRKRKRGGPVLIINNNRYIVNNLTQTEISIPWGVEIVWAVLTPLNSTSERSIQKIIFLKAFIDNFFFCLNFIYKKFVFGTQLNLLKQIL